jgi:glyoxylase-like metal-dependent hydrolase (beta-lactamase superfamily II)
LTTGGGGPGAAQSPREILPGLHHWKAVHPRIEIEVGCHYLASSRIAFDPLLPVEGVEWFERHGGVDAVILSNRHHLRHAERLAERYGCPIRCHQAGLHEFSDGPTVEGFGFGERLTEDVVALEMDAICPDDTVLRLETGPGALLFADALISYGGLGFVPDELIGDDPEAVKRQVRERALELAQEPIDCLLFAHGDPVLSGAKDALRQLGRTPS